jgi:hypothetical protein
MCREAVLQCFADARHINTTLMIHILTEYPKMEKELKELREQVKYMPPQYTVCSNCGVKRKLREGVSSETELRGNESLCSKGEGYHEAMQDYNKRSRSE